MISRKKVIITSILLTLIVIGSSLAFSSIKPETAITHALVPPSSPTFGNTDVGTIFDQNDPNTASVSYFQTNDSFLVTDIFAYVAGVSDGNCSAALYSVNGGSADALLAWSSSVAIGTTFGWVDFNLTTPYSVINGTTYGLAVMGDVSVNLEINNGTGQRDHNSAGNYSDGFADPFGTIWLPDYRGAMSIYATTTSQPTPTPTPSPTDSPTPVPTDSPAPTSTVVPTPTTTPTPLPTASPAPTDSPTPTVTPSAEPTAIPTETPTFTPTPTQTPNHTLSPTPKPSPTASPEPTTKPTSDNSNSQISPKPESDTSTTGFSQSLFILEIIGAESVLILAALIYTRRTPTK